MARGERTGSVWRTCALGFGCAAALAGCGTAQHFADRTRPPTPIDLTVYIGDHRVSISPDRIGAGPVTLFVTNQATRTETLTVTPAAAGGGTLASTGPINPGSPAQLQVNLKTGRYTVGAGSSLAAATLRVGKERASSDNALLQP